MKWLLLVPGVWLLLGLAAALVLGRIIWLADQRARPARPVLRVVDRR